MLIQHKYSKLQSPQIGSAINKVRDQLEDAEVLSYIFPCVMTKERWWTNVEKSIPVIFCATKRRLAIFSIEELPKQLYTSFHEEIEKIEVSRVLGRVDLFDMEIKTLSFSGEFSASINDTIYSISLEAADDLNEFWKDSAHAINSDNSPFSLFGLNAFYVDAKRFDKKEFPFIVELRIRNSIAFLGFSILTFLPFATKTNNQGAILGSILFSILWPYTLMGVVNPKNAALLDKSPITISPYNRFVAAVMLLCGFAMSAMILWHFLAVLSIKNH